MLCICGCGESVSPGRSFRPGHNIRISHPMEKLSSRQKIGLKTSAQMLGNTYAKGQKLGFKHTEETKDLISELSTKMWQNPESREKLLHHLRTWRTKYPEISRNQIRKSLGHQGISKPELRLKEILEDYDLPFTYNPGATGTHIDRRVPDFISNNGTKCVLEVFGEYYHLNPERLTDIETTEYYKKRGYGCLVLWASEIYNWEDLYIVYLIQCLMREAKEGVLSSID